MGLGAFRELAFNDRMDCSAWRFSVFVFATYALHTPTLWGRTSISTSILNEMNREYGIWAWRYLILDLVVFTGLGRR
jgi:hypothetical protein